MKLKLNLRITKTVVLSSAILLIALFSFLYFFTTRFPIGDDPANHILTIKNNSYLQLWQNTKYPIPLSIFKFLFKTTHIQPTVLFVALICTFLFIASIMMLFLSKQITKSWLVAIIASLLFVSDRWINDGLRMGLFAEAFGWIAFITCVFFYLKRNLPLFFLFFLILLFSHPFPSLAFIITLICFSMLELLSKTSTREEKRYALFVLALLGIGFLAARLLLPEKINGFINFDTSGLLGFSERTLYQFFATDSKKQLLLLIPFAIGIISSISNWKQREFRFLYILFFVGFFLSFNHVLGIHFLSFRFYPYSIMPFAVFSAIGIKTLVIAADFKKFYYLILITLVCLLLYLNNKINISYLKWQSKDISADAIMLPEDQEAISWLKENIAPSQTIVAPWKVSIWINSLNDNLNTVFYENIFKSEKNCINDTGINYEIVYVRQNSCNPLQIDFQSRYNQVFSNNGVKIYKLKQQ